ncbi:MAG: hypothetical protein JJU45_17395 [Acidimicrobiia bacterium]|nr:hypothetical protein [Acidimicrobiia bacterium]
MTPEEAAKEAAPAVRDVASHFMLDPDTYRVGGELGFPGMSFYVAGRGGSLGDVDASVVAAAMVFFSPALVADGWAASEPVMGRQDAARRFMGCGYDWARGHVPTDDELALGRLTELAGRLIEAASPAGAPLFAALRTTEEPADAPALALHRMNVLRELRAALHGGAILAAGLSPREAVCLRSPDMVGLFGWDPPEEDLAPLQASWDEAEAATDVAMGRTFEVLDAEERAQFVELAERLRRAVTP